MAWAVVHNARVFYRGSLPACGDAAAAHGLAPRIVLAVADLDCSATRGALIMPVALLPERYRRRAA